MITTSGMLAAMLTSESSLGYHRIYLAAAIGAGALMGSWMNDSGFWIFAKMGGLTEAESLKSWTVLLAILSIISMSITLLLAITMPMA
jgi:H+/gluconate symporter-like permease